MGATREDGMQICPSYLTNCQIFSIVLEILFLQIEPCDDQSGNNASDVFNNSSDMNTGSHLPAVKEVINFL